MAACAWAVTHPATTQSTDLSLIPRLIQQATWQAQLEVPEYDPKTDPARKAKSNDPG